MLEGLVAWVLNNYLGKYVYLDTDQLSVALLRGRVELENVPLRTDALRHLGLPIQIRAGFIGKVQLQIPVRQIQSAPWVITLEQLYVVASLLPLDEWDNDSEQSVQNDLKLSALDNLEAKWRLERDMKDRNDSSFSTWDSNSTGFVSKVIENLQLKIQDVHIRYEDSTSNPGRPVAFGITIDSLTAYSCDDNWVPGFVKPGKTDHSFKLLKLDNFAIYWIMLGEGDSYVKLNVSDLAERMSPSKSKNTIKNYIVPSVSAQAHLKRNRSTQPLRSSSTPRVTCDLILEEVPLTLVDWQYNQIVTCVKGLENIGRLRAFRRYKPCLSVKEDPKAWWRYAISCFYPGGQPGLCRPRPTWETCLVRARHNVKYVQVYKKLLVTPTKALTAMEKKVKDEVEWDREYEDLRILREVAMRTVPLPTKVQQNSSMGGKLLKRWFPRWKGWDSTTSPENSTQAAPEATQLEVEILQVLTDSVENNTVLKRDAAFGQINFCLKNGTLNLCTIDQESKETTSMLELEFKNVSLMILSKPRTSSHRVELSLDALYLKDRITRDTMFPVLVGPPGHDRTSVAQSGASSGPSPRAFSSGKSDEVEQQLFQLTYEKRPPNSGCDYRLSVKTKCLDVVYQPNAVKWLTDFICLPYQRDIIQSRIEAMKSRTKKELTKNWEEFLEGRVAARSTWGLELNISAPQIIFVEDFTDQNSAIAVFDFGRLQLRNNASSTDRESEESETYFSPWSTPSVSEKGRDSGERTEQASPLDDPPDFKLDEANLHNKLYDNYSLELSDLQILIGKAKENWRYALNKGSSALHVLDNFSISLQIERRVVYTSDPLYPSLTLNANLPKLVVHLNENKIKSGKNLLQHIVSTGLPSPFTGPDTFAGDSVDSGQDNDESISIDTSVEQSRCLKMQFTADQMTLELQSRGRPMAELQVAGVNVAFTKRSVETSMTLTVHSLLVVDALQTFGPDFKLLMASHKHVGMDSMSGSLRDSKPTSPTSPGSPDPNIVRQNANSPVSLTQALSTVSDEALITVEFCLISGPDPICIANIQFNNLDIIANQETIVELVGFVRRVFPQSQKPSNINLSPEITSSVRESLLDETTSNIGTTELTVDFHRLNVLLLRGVVTDGKLYGKKICTATMSEAKIHATVAGKLEVEGSLGGLQVLDLTPEGQVHQRIVSVGRDPLLEVSHSINMMTAPQKDDRKAFSYNVVRNLENSELAKDVADVTIRMASLWYTHSPKFLTELQSCATEFKQYITNLARSIQTAATDMALGFVHARAETLAQSLSMNKRLISSSDSGHRRTSSKKQSGYTSATDTMLQTPYSQGEEDDFVLDFNLDIQLDSPVLVLPRSSASPEVFVAHLGKISISNRYDSALNGTLTKGYQYEFDENRREHYDIDIRDMNIFALNTSSRRVSDQMIIRPEVLYSCKTSAKPILHDTMLQLNVVREVKKPCLERNKSETILLDIAEENDAFNDKPGKVVVVSGSMVSELKLSLTRAQFEQVLDTIDWHTTFPTPNESQGISQANLRLQSNLSEIREEDSGVTTLNMDPHVRAKLISPSSAPLQESTAVPSQNLETSIKLNFEVPVFTVELRGDGPRGEQGLVDLIFRDFVFKCEKCRRFETSIRVALRSVFMEDLLQPEGSRQRSMAISSNGSDPPPTTSPSQGRERPEKNLVLVSIVLVDPSVPNFDTQYRSTKQSTIVDFNCLDLIISIPSWVMVIDFFLGSESSTNSSSTSEEIKVSSSKTGKVITNITVCSLNVVFVKPDRDVARANISTVELMVKTRGLHQEVTGTLGSMSLLDLTSHGQIYKERFLTSGQEALQFQYIRHIPDGEKEYDAQLTLDMASVMYVHTKRFVAEIQDFWNKFIDKLETVMKGIQATTNGKAVSSEPLRLSLILRAGSPIILAPVSSKSTHLIIADVGQLLVTNTFKFSGEDGTISVLSDPKSQKKCLLDVMFIKLQNIVLSAGIKENESSPTKRNSSEDSFQFGSTCITRKGPSLLPNKFELQLQFERNLHKNICHPVPDSSIYAHLSTLDGTLDLHQYKVIRGICEFNFGENTEKICPSVPPRSISSETEHRDEWTTFSFKFDLQNVSVRLVKSHNHHSPLTCVNFIKSQLTADSFSDFSQDVDLVSEEILVIDTRFHGSESESHSNVFTNILQPMKDASSSTGLVQAEVHSRRIEDYTRFAILLNNMRLMAIFDWWQEALEYLLQEIESDESSPEHQSLGGTQSTTTSNKSFELIVNITDSEVVLVEDSSQWDSNAVILKSTTVVKYRPTHIEKPLSCILSNCEMFSCILGQENETALSIVDPITLTMELVNDGVLQAQLQFLTVRLSYHDMRMFRQMLESLPKQMFPRMENRTAQTSIVKTEVETLTALGFARDDCLRALGLCENRLDDAAMWLTQNAEVVSDVKGKNALSITSIEVNADGISICIIDDCGDSDVPLLEFSLSDLKLVQVLPELNPEDPVHPSGYLHCSLAGNYYNRVLSGWEPIIEPWTCNLSWEKALSQNPLENRSILRLHSDDTINVNITSTFMDGYKLVKENWTKDFSAQKVLDCFRTRSPFVPYALKNETGSSLKFTRHIVDLNMPNKLAVESNEKSWIVVEPGCTIPFSFTRRDKLRHQNSHKLRMHQIGVEVDGWRCTEPVAVDKVGTYFRDTPAELQDRYVDVPPARIVFDVALDGSARKLITVRSALMIINNLPELIEVKLESRLPPEYVTLWVPSKRFTIDPKATLSVPLLDAHSQINIRPTGSPHQCTYSTPALTWDQMPNNVDRMFLSGTCDTHKGDKYRFCAEILREKVLTERSTRIEQPAHRIILLPTVKLVNLLPVDMQYLLSGEKGIIKAGQNAALTGVDPGRSVNLEIKMNNLQSCTSFIIPSGSSEFSHRIMLKDNRQRKLYVTAEILVNKGARLKITVFAPYWIINKTGLPLVFKQSDASYESAAQFDEHELARMVSPLLFSFSDQGVHAINARVGKGAVRDGATQWCSKFHVGKGTQSRNLHVTTKDSMTDRVFTIGIEVRQGRGKYRGTHIIYISPLYQLHNRSSYKLAFSQACVVEESHPLKFDDQSFLKIMPNAFMPFDWSRLDKDHLLCVSIEDIPDCYWSGGFKIDPKNSMHINVRDSQSRVFFLRLEVVLQGATFYVVFTDVDTMPPPVRVDNFSEVSIRFGQDSYFDVMHSTAKAHSSVPYAWDEPTSSHYIRLVAPGGVARTYDMNNLGPVSELTYENFSYIAFVGTFKNSQKVEDLHDVESQELVMDVGKNNQVFLARKIPDQRSQLWRLTPEGYLQHEGSSPSNHPNAPRSKDDILVLDIADTAPQPDYHSRLTLRNVDHRRQATQTWRFTDEGRLCCDNYNMCVQAEDGFYGLIEGGAVVLGLPQLICHKLTDKGIPIEQAIEYQRSGPGSGSLSVNISMDGPTQVITIEDVKENRISAMPDDGEWVLISERPRLTLEEDDTNKEHRELQFNLDLRGIGISLICRRAPEELLYAHFSNIMAETVMTPQYKRFCVSVKDIQVDNQLLDATVPVVLYVTPPRINGEATDHLPAIELKFEIQSQLNENAVIFKHLILKLKKITAIIEEKLLLKLSAFFGLHSEEEELTGKDEGDCDMQKLLTEVSAASAKRYYFDVLKVIPDEITLSAQTASKLSEHLKRIKKKQGLTLIKFEDAAILLEPFHRMHPFETSQFLLNSIMEHFKAELKWQAAVILGSIDFIGNPIGLMNDISEGVSGLILDGNVGGLVKNVTHGLSNSAAKVTGSLGDGLGKITMDHHHEEMRQKIRRVESGKSSDHIVAGIKGLGFGLLGGATGIFTQVYEGASNDGVAGVFTGLGKGVVGVFTKPVAGVMDFASETAKAVRDSSSSKLTPERRRFPRCIYGPGSLLPRFDPKHSQGQLYLYAINNKNYEEKLLACQVLGSSASEEFLCIVSDKLISIVTRRARELIPVIECPLSHLESCNAIKENVMGQSRYYIEIVMHYTGSNAALGNSGPIKRQRVMCWTEDLAVTTAQQINYAKTLYVEHLYTLASDENITTWED